MKLSPLVLIAALGCAGVVQADENLLGYVKGAETLPAGGQELYQWVTLRNDKGTGKYQAIDFKTEYEKGITDRFTASAALRFLSLDTSGILIDGYLPADRQFNLKFSGLELGGKYNYLSPAADDFGLSIRRKTSSHFVLCCRQSSALSLLRSRM